MNNISTLTVVIFVCIAVLILGESVYLFVKWRRSKKTDPNLAFLISNNKNLNHMAIISTLNLTSLVVQTLTLGMVDQNNNNAPIPGVLSNISVSSGDGTQDTAVLNTTVPNGVDIDAVSQTGGTTVTASAAFASTKVDANGNPIVSGTFTATLTVVNAVVVKAALVFNQ